MKHIILKLASSDVLVFDQKDTVQLFQMISRARMAKTDWREHNYALQPGLKMEITLVDPSMIVPEKPEPEEDLPAAAPEPAHEEVPAPVYAETKPALSSDDPYKDVPF